MHCDIDYPVLNIAYHDLVSLELHPHAVSRESYRRFYRLNSASHRASPRPWPCQGTCKLSIEVDGGGRTTSRMGTYKISDKDGYSQMEFVFLPAAGHPQHVEFVFYSGEENYTKIDILVGIWFMTGVWPEGVPST